MICSLRYPTHITISFVPCFLNHLICHSIIGMFKTSIIGLGLSSVNGLNLFPKPPAKIIAFMVCQSYCFVLKSMRNIGGRDEDKNIFDSLSIKALSNLTFATPRFTKYMPVSMGQRLLILLLLEFPLLSAINIIIPAVSSQ